MEQVNQPRGAFERRQPELSPDERVIQRGIRGARVEDREVDDAVARGIAAQLHGGQDSALYSLASTGSLEDERLHGELRELYQSPNPRILEWAGVLGTYALHREHKGPVEGWSALWPNGADAPSPGDAEVHTRLPHRSTVGAATALGQVATVDPPAYSESHPAAGHPDESEADTYPWSDAVRWRPDGGPDELAGAETISSEAIQELFICLPEAEHGIREQMGWIGLVRNPDGSGGAILRENQYGRRSAWTTDSADALAHRWQEAEHEHHAFQSATGSRADGQVGQDSPRIWVGSLADYVAGYLHGEWLDADLDADELAAAVQFILKNSHEPEAEEYGVFDYDGFGHGLTSMLGEYPSLATVSKLGQGIAEHGEAFAAWAAYVGSENAEQLDRFEDQYLGEWENIEAYAQELLEESEAFRIIDEAPVWLRPYIQVDVDGYARDLGYELYVVEKAAGGVLVFDTRA